MQIINKLKFFYLKKIKKIILPRDLIVKAVEKNKDLIVAIDCDKKYTYQEIYERGVRLANSFKRINLKKGDRVAVLLSNCKEYFEIRIAAYLSGIILVPIVPDMSIDDTIFILNDCGVKVLIYNEELFDTKIKENTKVQKFISLEKDYETFIALGGLDKIKVDLKPDDLASINFSSGTTGRPRGIMLTQRNWISSFYNYVLNSPRALEKDIKMLHIISLATAGGTAFLPTFFLGVENFFLDKFSEEKAVSLIISQKINTIFITPSWLNMLVDYCKCNKVKLHLKNIIIGTEPISKGKFKEAIEFFGPIIQEGYGMAEVLPPLSLIGPKDYLKNGKLDESKLIYVGKSMNNVEVKIVDTEAGIGRILVKSSTISKGYLNNPALDKECFKDGWFVSDDFGYINKEGYLCVLGRAQDILDSDKKIFRKEIEEVLYEHPDILEAFAFLKNDKVSVFVSFKRDSKIISEQELLDFCNKKLKNISIYSIKVLPVLPKGCTGKIDRKKLLLLDTD